MDGGRCEWMERMGDSLIAASRRGFMHAAPPHLVCSCLKSEHKYPSHSNLIGRAPVMLPVYDSDRRMQKCWILGCEPNTRSLTSVCYLTLIAAAFQIAAAILCCHHGLQWNISGSLVPDRTASDPGTAMLHRDINPANGMEQFLPIDHSRI